MILLHIFYDNTIIYCKIISSDFFKGDFLIGFNLYTTDLDHSIRFLHEINQSRTSLVYDIQELLRWLVDVSVIQLLEEKKIKKSDFIIQRIITLG